MPNMDQIHVMGAIASMAQPTAMMVGYWSCAYKYYHDFKEHPGFTGRILAVD